MNFVSFRGSLYEESTIPGKILKYIHDKYILFTMVDNDFKKDTVIYQAIAEAADLYEQQEKKLGLGVDNYIANLWAGLLFQDVVQRQWSK